MGSAMSMSGSPIGGPAVYGGADEGGDWTAKEGSAISSADIHGTVSSESRGVDVEFVRANGERLYNVEDEDTRAVSVLDKGNGSSDVVVDRLGARVGDRPITAYELTNGQVEARIESGRWQRELGG